MKLSTAGSPAASIGIASMDQLWVIQSLAVDGLSHNTGKRGLDGKHYIASGFASESRIDLYGRSYTHDAYGQE